MTVKGNSLLETVTLRHTFFISDLDGTLLRTDQTLSERTRQHLKYFTKNGIQWTLATGRSYVSTKHLLTNAGITLNLPIIAQNGALIIHTRTGERLHIHALQTDMAYAILTTLKNGHHPFFVSCHRTQMESWYHHQLDVQKVRFFTGTAPNIRYHAFRDIASLQYQTILSIYSLGTYKEIIQLCSRLKPIVGVGGDLFYFQHRQKKNAWWLCIHAKEATKGQAVLRLLSKHSYPNPTIYVFGDRANDLSMFKISSFIGCAVHNADAVLKRHAQHIIDSNENDGVVQFIKTCQQGS